MNSCKNCKFFLGMSIRNEYECDWLYRTTVLLPPYLAIANRNPSVIRGTEDCYPKRFKEDLGWKCSVFKEKER